MKICSKQFPQWTPKTVKDWPKTRSMVSLLVSRTTCCKLSLNWSVRAVIRSRILIIWLKQLIKVVCKLRLLPKKRVNTLTKWQTVKTSPSFCIANLKRQKEWKMLRTYTRRLSGEVTIIIVRMEEIRSSRQTHHLMQSWKRKKIAWNIEAVGLRSRNNRRQSQISNG